MLPAATVLGAGELGRACACALAANHSVAAVRLLTRDVAMAAPTTAAAPHPSRHRSGSEGAAAAVGRWPSTVSLRDVRGCRGEAAAPQPLFLCTPCVSYLAADDAWARAAYGGAHSPTTQELLSAWRPATTSTAAAAATPSNFVAVFSRGFTADGAVAAELAESLLNEPHAERGGAAVVTPVLVASGPVVAQEWARQSTPVVAGAAPSPLSPDPPRPRSALMASASPAPASTADGGQLPHAYSGVALTFAAWTPSIAADAGRQAALAEQLQLLFPRESVTYLTAPDAAAVLALVNACAPLCSFGAGLVSSVYVGTSTTSLAAYAQHAVAATEQLANALLGRTPGTPLPLPAVATLWCACTSLVSREFALGRKLDFYFRKQDAIQAVYHGHEHHVFAATVDGLHERMRGCGVASPLYEVLMDTYNTMVRASRAGEGLVKEGYYGYREVLADGAGGGELLQQAVNVDEAMLSGDEARFTAAKERIMRTFAASTF
ncbi:hypothetical protein NESM_000078500 [Novymonas esmeraldas]|uniref:Uncharacterized protein n=1 Tax=Novymonas esmeraldas TaxID=1808958 RepID=A0AAW0F4V6_9TRYP